MPLTLVQTIPPVVEPVTIAEVKKHIGGTIAVSEDQYISSLITTTREFLENESRRQFNTATWILALDEFPDCRIIKIPRPPLVSVTHIKYQDSNNIETTLATSQYGLDVLSEPARIYSMPNVSWPNTYDVPNAVKITYIAGVEHASQVRATIREVMLLIIADLYSYRTSPTVEGCLDPNPYIRDMINGFRIWEFS